MHTERGFTRPGPGMSEPLGVLVVALQVSAYTAACGGNDYETRKPDRVRSCDLRMTISAHRWYSPKPDVVPFPASSATYLKGEEAE